MLVVWTAAFFVREPEVVVLRWAELVLLLRSVNVQRGLTRRLRIWIRGQVRQLT
jgi:hypothetical protein